MQSKNKNREYIIIVTLKSQTSQFSGILQILKMVLCTSLRYLQPASKDNLTRGMGLNRPFKKL